MGCSQSVSADDKCFDPPLTPTVYSTASSRTYVFDDQATIPDNFCFPEIQVVDNAANNGYDDPSAQSPTRNHHGGGVRS